MPTTAFAVVVMSASPFELALRKQTSSAVRDWSSGTDCAWDLSDLVDDGEKSGQVLKGRVRIERDRVLNPRGMPLVIEAAVCLDCDAVDLDSHLDGLTIRIVQNTEGHR